jgi:hypothetical protein
MMDAMMDAMTAFVGDRRPSFPLRANFPLSPSSSSSPLIIFSSHLLLLSSSPLVFFSSPSSSPLIFFPFSTSSSSSPLFSLFSLRMEGRDPPDSASSIFTPHLSRSRRRPPTRPLASSSTTSSRLLSTTNNPSHHLQDLLFFPLTPLFFLFSPSSSIHSSKLFDDYHHPDSHFVSTSSRFAPEFLLSDVSPIFLMTPHS